MKLVTVLFVGLATLSAESKAEGYIVKEEVLNQWGYQTISNSNNSQQIKSIRPLPDMKETYYPRFTLYKKCYSSTIKTLNALDTITLHPSDKSNKRRELELYGSLVTVDNNCLWMLSAHAQLFTYHQDDLLERLDLYLSNL